MTRKRKLSLIRFDFNFYFIIYIYIYFAPEVSSYLLVLFVALVNVFFAGSSA